MADLPGTSAADIRRRVEGWRAAERREHALRARMAAMEPVDALEAAFELHGLCPDVFGPADAVRVREDQEARAAWRRLRARLVCRRADARSR